MPNENKVRGSGGFEFGVTRSTTDGVDEGRSQRRFSSAFVEHAATLNGASSLLEGSCYASTIGRTTSTVQRSRLLGRWQPKSTKCTNIALEVLLVLVPTT